MRRDASIFIIFVLSIFSLFTFQNCAKQPQLKALDLSSISTGTAISGLKYETPSAYAQGMILVSSTPSNPSAVTLTAAVNSDLAGLKAIFNSGSYLTIVPGQSLFIQIQYPASLDSNSVNLFWNNIQNGVALGKAAFTDANKSSLQIDYYRKDTTDVQPAIYSIQLEANSKSTGALVGRSNVLNVKLAPVCKPSFSAPKATTNDSFQISVSTMSSLKGDESISGSVSKMIMIPVNPSGNFGQQILLAASNGTTGIVSASQLNLGDNLFRLVALSSNGDVICGSLVQSLNVYQAPSPTPTPSPSPSPSPSATPDPFQKIKLLADGFICSDHQVRVRIRHNSNKDISADVMGSSPAGVLDTNCDYKTPSTIEVVAPDNSRPSVLVGNEIKGAVGGNADRITKVTIKSMSYQEYGIASTYWPGDGDPQEYITGDLSNASSVAMQDLTSQCLINTTVGFPVFANAFPGYRGQIAKIHLEIEVETYKDGKSPSIPYYPITSALYPNCNYGTTYNGGGGGQVGGPRTQIPLK